MEQDGNLLHLRWDAVPLLSDQVIMGAMLIFEDITETVSLISRMEDWERLATVGRLPPAWPMKSAIHWLRQVRRSSFSAGWIMKISAES